MSDKPKKRKNPGRKDVVVEAPLMGFSIEPQQTNSNESEEVKPDQR